MPGRTLTRASRTLIGRYQAGTRAVPGRWRQAARCRRRSRETASRVGARRSARSVPGRGRADRFRSARRPRGHMRLDEAGDTLCRLATLRRHANPAVPVGGRVVGARGPARRGRPPGVSVAGLRACAQACSSRLVCAIDTLRMAGASRADSGTPARPCQPGHATENCPVTRAGQLRRGGRGAGRWPPIR